MRQFEASSSYTRITWRRHGPVLMKDVYRKNNDYVTKWSKLAAFNACGLLFITKSLSNLTIYTTTSSLVLLFAGRCSFTARFQSTHTETSLELITVDIRAKQTPKPNFPLRLPVPTRCFSTITILHGGSNTSSPPTNKTCLHGLICFHGSAMPCVRWRFEPPCEHSSATRGTSPVPGGARP